MSNATEDDTEHEDLENYKRFFLYRTIRQVERQQFSMLWQQFCSLRQSQLNLNWQLFRIHPTLGVRALLGKDNLHAEWAGEALVFWECRNVTPVAIHWSGKVNDTCYKYTPVQLETNGPLWFVSPGSKDLTQHSPVEDCAHTTPHYFQDENGEWFSAHGPVHVTDIPIEVVWKGLWSTFTFSAPSLFSNFIERMSTFSETRYQLQRLLKVETALHRLVNYTADMSFDPDVVRSMVSGVGEGIGKMVEGAGSGLGHLISGTVHGFGGFISGILKGPFQMLLNIAIVLIVIGLVIIVAYKFIQWRSSKGKTNFLPEYLQTVFNKFKKRNSMSETSPKLLSEIPQPEQENQEIVESIEMEEFKPKPKEDHASNYALRYIDTTI